MAAADTFSGLPTVVRPDYLKLLPDTPMLLMLALLPLPYRPEPTVTPPLVLATGFTLMPDPTLGTFEPMIGWRFGRNGCFLGKVSARCKMFKICSEESIDIICWFFWGCWDCLEAVVESVAFEPPWPSFLAAL